MKIDFIFSTGTHYFYYDRVVRLLHAGGHEVRIVCPADLSTDGNKSGRALIKLLEDQPKVRLEPALLRRKHRNAAETIRGLMNYAAYVRSEHPTPHLALKWARKGLSPRKVRLIQNPFVKAALSTRAARWVLAFLERLISPDEKIVNRLEENQPDAIFLTPYIFSNDLEVEYAKAARKLNIPSIASVLSWDNLTSKGTYHVKPDWLFVWNRNLTDEAVQIHDFDRQRVFAAGAPVYDPWFELTPSVDRKILCLQAGINPEKPYILYLCSSRGISDNEVELIRELTANLGSIRPEDRPSVMIRPHPFNPVEPGEVENDWVRVFPKGGQRPDSDEARQLYYDSLYHSALVFGINTTGFLEAALADKPCVTLVNPLTSYGQEKRAHFKHLMDADFIEVAKDYAGLVECIGEIVKGADANKANRKNFVNHFLRPQGVNIPASEVVAGAILAVGRGARPEDWNVRYSTGAVMTPSPSQ